MQRLKALVRITRLRTVLRANMLLGALGFAVSVYLIVTGQYHNLMERRAVEATLNYAALGSLLYGVLFWYICKFGGPFLMSNTERG